MIAVLSDHLRITIAVDVDEDSDYQIDSDSKGDNEYSDDDEEGLGLLSKCFHTSGNLAHNYLLPTPPFFSFWILLLVAYW